VGVCHVAISVAVCGCSRSPEPPTAKPSESAVPSKSMATASSPAPAPSSPPNAAELSQAAEVRLAKISPKNVGPLMALLDNPNPYLRAGALSRLAKHGPKLSRRYLEAVVESLNDHARVTSGSCLGYGSIRRAVMGQGQMLLAAECNRYHTNTVGERAVAVLESADATLLAPELVEALSKQPGLGQYCVALVDSRPRQFSLPLQRELVESVRAAELAERDAALLLLQRVELGTVDLASIDTLTQLSHSRDEVLALRAGAVLLILLHDSGATVEPNHGAEATRQALRRALGRDPREVCRLSQGCASASFALGLLQNMREAAAPLLPEVVSLLDSDEEFVRIRALMVLGAMREKARPAVPKLIALLNRRRGAPIEESGDVTATLESLAAIRSTSTKARRAIVRAAEAESYHLEAAAAALAAMRLPVPPRERSVLRRAYENDCRDAGAIANFSFSRDDRCGRAAESLKTVDVRVDE